MTEPIKLARNFDNIYFRDIIKDAQKRTPYVCEPVYDIFDRECRCAVSGEISNVICDDRGCFPIDEYHSEPGLLEKAYLWIRSLDIKPYRPKGEDIWRGWKNKVER